MAGVVPVNREPVPPTRPLIEVGVVNVGASVISAAVNSQYPNPVRGGGETERGSLIIP
jgi:hypothetical protein